MACSKILEGQTASSDEKCQNIEIKVTELCEEKNNFELNCKIKSSDFLIYTTKINFLQCIESNFFIFADEKNKLSGQEINSKNELKIIANSIFKLIRNQCFKILSQKKDDILLSVMFDHEYLPSKYLLNLPFTIFKKKYVNIQKDQKNFKNVLLELLTDLTNVSTKINTIPMRMYVNRTFFVNRKHWDSSPFDIPYSPNDLYKNISADKPRRLRKYFADILFEDKTVENQYVQYILQTIHHFHCEKKNNIYGKQELSVSNIGERLHYFAKCYIKENYNITAPNLSIISLQFIKEDFNVWLFEGKLLLKVDNNLRGCLLNSTNYLRGNSSATGISEKSLRDFLKINTSYNIGHVNCENHLISDKFCIEYTYQQDRTIQMIHQLELKNKTLYFKNLIMCNEPIINATKVTLNVGNNIFYNEIPFASKCFKGINMSSYIFTKFYSLK